MNGLQVSYTYNIFIDLSILSSSFSLVDGSMTSFGMTGNVGVQRINRKNKSIESEPHASIKTRKVIRVDTDLGPGFYFV